MSPVHRKSSRVVLIYQRWKIIIKAISPIFNIDKFQEITQSRNIAKLHFIKSEFIPCFIQYAQYNSLLYPVLSVLANFVIKLLLLATSLLV